jgi:hypothetical protein
MRVAAPVPLRIPQGGHRQCFFSNEEGGRKDKREKTRKVTPNQNDFAAINPVFSR